jgi:hypothetical protein
MDYAYPSEAKRHREMADECRTIAACLTDEGVCAQYRKLAEAYEQLADNEDRVAHNIKALN